MTLSLPQGVATEIQQLAPDAVVELFEIDLSSVGGPVVRYHDGTSGTYQPIVWNAQTYYPFPIQHTGFEWNGRGRMPRPRMQVSNVTGAITTLILTYPATSSRYGDLIGCKVTRKRTFVRYLDAANFAAGNANADPTAAFPDEIFFVEQKTVENRNLVEFELAAAFDFQGFELPRRPVVQNVCTWIYRSSECGYTGTAYFDANDNSVSTAAQDVCGKRLSSCKIRFGANAPLPYGGFPAAGLVRA